MCRSARTKCIVDVTKSRFTIAPTCYTRVMDRDLNIDPICWILSIREVGISSRRADYSILL